MPPPRNSCNSYLPMRAGSSMQDLVYQSIRNAPDCDGAPGETKICSVPDDLTNGSQSNRVCWYPFARLLCNRPAHRVTTHEAARVLDGPRNRCPVWQQHRDLMARASYPRTCLGVSFRPAVRRFSAVL